MKDVHWQCERRHLAALVMMVGVTLADVEVILSYPIGEKQAVVLLERKD